MYFQILIPLLLISFFIKIIILKKILKLKFSSDESAHFYFINRIKWNNHRFVREREAMLFNSKEGYPQLFHWLLSFFPIGFIKKNSILISIFLEFILHLLIVIFAYQIIILNNIEINFFSLLIFSFFLLFSPHILDLQNARNRGLSPRVFGIILGVMSIVFVYLYLLTGNIVYLLISSFLFTLVILSSQFAMQVILFSIPIISIILFKFELLLVLLLGILFSIIISYNYTIQFFKLKIGHYRWFYKIGSKIFLLPARPSIWLDIFYFKRKYKEKGLIKTLRYYWESPILKMLFDFPLNFLIIIYIVMNFNNLELNLLFIFAIMGILLFILTSFNLTRFLGEPERYSGFFQVFIFVYLFLIEINYIILIIIFLITIIRMVGNVYSVFLTSKDKLKSSKSINIEKMIYNKYSKENDRVLFYSINMCKKISVYIKPSKKIKLFWGGAYSNFIGKYRFDKVFDFYPVIKSKMIPLIVKDFKINLCIIEESDKKVISNLKKQGFQIISKIDDIIILRKNDHQIKSESIYN